MTETPAAPRRPRRPPRTTTVLETERLSPHLIRVVVGGDGLQGFGVGEFTDHYVKLLIPPPGAPYSAPFDVEEDPGALPARAMAARHARTPCATGTPDRSA